MFEEHPGYNEQRWTLRTTSGDLNVQIASRPYWAWGLMTSGYLNIITLEGPLAERARLVLDTASALGQPPWEMAHQRTAERWLKLKLPSMDLKTNEQTWRALLESGRNRLNEAIEAMQLRCDGAISAHKSDEQGWEDALHDDLHMARRALSEDNAPGVERALARLEAHLIQMSTEPESGFIPAPEAVHSDGSDVFWTGAQGLGERFERTLVLEEKETVPFVDLSGSSTNQDEE